MTTAFALPEKIDARMPDTGKTVDIVGIAIEAAVPKLVVLHRRFDGVFAELVDKVLPPKRG